MQFVTHNGRGTYDMIINNLEKLRLYSPGYYSDRVSFLSVISDYRDIADVSEFFENKEFVSSVTVKWEFVYVKRVEKSLEVLCYYRRVQ